MDVDKADAEATTVIVSDNNDDNSSNDDDATVPAVMATQTFSGVTVAQASESSFQTIVVAAVAKVKYSHKLISQLLGQHSPNFIHFACFSVIQSNN